MMRTFSRTAIAAAAVLAVMAGATLAVRGQSGAKNGEWPTYGGDLGSTRYSPLDQITRDNFKDLQIAWRFKTDSLGPRLEYNLESTPLMAKGVLYATAGTRRAVVALNPVPASCSGCTPKTRARAAPQPPGDFRDAGSHIGAMASRSGFCT